MKLQAPTQGLFRVASSAAFTLRRTAPVTHSSCTRFVSRFDAPGWGFVVASKLVLWSPVGAPAGVPGPRRNADDCDAGWFAPVATRRRPIFGALQAPSPWLAVSSRGDDPPEPPGWDAYPVGRQLRPWCVGPLAAPWSLGLMVCPDTSVGAAVCTFKQRCARLEGTHSPPEILTRAPTSGPETRPPRCRRVRRQPSRELPAAVRPAGHWPHTGPSPRAGGIPALGGR